MLTMPIYLLGGSCYQDMILILSDDTKLNIIVKLQIQSNTQHRT